MEAAMPENKTKPTTLSVGALLGHGNTDALLGGLGKYTTGKGCLYIKKLSDVDKTLLEGLVKRAIAHGRAR